MFKNKNYKSITQYMKECKKKLIGDDVVITVCPEVPFQNKAFMLDVHVFTGL